MHVYKTRRHIVAPPRLNFAVSGNTVANPAVTGENSGVAVVSKPKVNPVKIYEMPGAVKIGDLDTCLTVFSPCAAARVIRFAVTRQTSAAVFHPSGR